MRIALTMEIWYIVKGVLSLIINLMINILLIRISAYLQCVWLEAVLCS